MKYRTKDELKEYEKQDPLVRIKSYILDNEIAEEDKIEEIQEQVEQEIMDAIDFAENSEFPPEEDLYKDVFVEDDYPFHR